MAHFKQRIRDVFEHMFMVQAKEPFVPEPYPTFFFWQQLLIYAFVAIKAACMGKLK